MNNHFILPFFCRFNKWQDLAAGKRKSGRPCRHRASGMQSRDVTAAGGFSVRAVREHPADT
jgi:hypothetical protein